MTPAASASGLASTTRAPSWRRGPTALAISSGVNGSGSPITATGNKDALALISNLALTAPSRASASAATRAEMTVKPRPSIKLT